MPLFRIDESYTHSDNLTWTQARTNCASASTWSAIT